MAPPTKTTALALSELRFALETGATLREAASIAGISVRTLHRWIKRGFRGDGVAFELVRRLVHEARRLDPVVVVRTGKGLALRRSRARRPTVESILRDLEKSHRRVNPDARARAGDE